MRKFPKEFYITNMGLRSKRMKCQRCHKWIEHHGGLNHCPHCGVKIEECCQGGGPDYHVPSDPSESIDDKDLPN